MPISTNEILKLVCDLSEEENIKIAVTESLKGGALTASTTIIGGLILGPIGLATGGLFGGVASYFMCKGKYESVPSIIMKMEPSQKELLANRIRNIVNELDYTDLVQITVLMMTPELKTRLTYEIVDFLKTQMNMNVLC